MTSFIPQSLFTEKLDTNYVPSDSDIDAIRSLLAEPKLQLTELDNQIAALAAKRQSLQGEINAYEALLSPMRRIPEDLLREIFMACLPTENAAFIDPTGAPLLLGRVCRHWRNVAQSTPQLWQTLHIPSLPLSTPPYTVSSLVNTIEAWLARSGSCPLSISYGDSADISLFEPLIHVSHRIRHLLLCHLSLDPLPIGREQFPILETICFRSFSLDEELWNEFTRVRNPAKLRHVTINSNGNALGLSLPWSQLTSLLLNCDIDWRSAEPSGLDSNDVLILLSRCSNLVRCYLLVTAEAIDHTSLAITLPHLKQLILAFHDFQSTSIRPGAILERLVMPKLCHVAIGPTSDSPVLISLPEPHESFVLDVFPTFFLEEDFLQILQLFPRMCHLCIRHNHNKQRIFSSPVGETVLAALAPLSPHGPTSFPLLTRLQIDGIVSIPDTAIIPFIRRRVASGHPLESLSMHFLREQEVDVLSELRESGSLYSDIELKLEYLPAERWQYDATAGLWTC